MSFERWPAAAARTLVLLVLAATGCGGQPATEGTQESESPPVRAAVRELVSPASAGSFAPRLAAAGDTAVMTWLESGEVAGRHRVRFARLTAGRWSAPATIVEGDDLFANWADYPAVVAAADGSLYAHWLAKTGEATYAYSIFLARSADGGATWEALGQLNDDATDTEHGFVSWVAEGDGARAVWLDGREMAAGGPMTLRTALVAASGVGEGRVLDSRVCECCTTAATRAGENRVVVAYRDRDEGEIRDVSLVRGGEDGWSAPRTPIVDGWRIAGCPVNGPAVAAGGSRVALAWFTAAADRPVVRAALSSDGGETFAPPVEIDGAAPLGRVDIQAVGDAAWVGWMAAAGEEAEIRLLEISPDGVGEPVVVATTSAARAGGFPSLLALPGRLLVAWTEVADEAPSRVRLAEMPFDAAPD